MSFKRRRIATLDLGTNSLLMLVAERDEEGALHVLSDESAMPKLGEGLRTAKKIPPHVLDRTCETLSGLVSRARGFSVDEIHLTATSASREAENQEELLTRLKEVMGSEAEVLPPSEESRLTYLSVTIERGGHAPSMVVDIGGGSTEITWGIGPRFDGGRSLDLGTVKLLDGPLRHDPPTEDELQAARKEIDLRLSRVTPLADLDHYYGTAGSFTHLASIDMELTEYHSEKISGYRLTPEKTAKWIERLSKMTREERLTLPGLDPRRADVVLGGTLIIERLFSKFKNDAFEVYDRGIRFGKLFHVIRTFVPPIHW